MKTEEQIRDEYDKQMEELKIWRESMDQIPEPKRIQTVALHGVNSWIIYNRDSLQEAMDLMRSFEVVPAIIQKGLFTSITPSVYRNTDKFKDISGEEFDRWVSVDNWETEVNFLVNLKGLIHQIKVKIPTQEVGRFFRDNPRKPKYWRWVFESKKEFSEQWQMVLKYAGSGVFGDGSYGKSIWRRRDG